MSSTVTAHRGAVDHLLADFIIRSSQPKRRRFDYAWRDRADGSSAPDCGHAAGESESAARSAQVTEPRVDL
jgi:hypothetical protein